MKKEGDEGTHTNGTLSLYTTLQIQNALTLREVELSVNYSTSVITGILGAVVKLQTDTFGTGLKCPY